MTGKELGFYMPLLVDDFIGGTIAFGADEIGGYIMLLMYQWSNLLFSP